MNTLFVALIALWFIWEIKYVLFWLYLWQLKDYHIGRFIDHFTTHKGKKIFLNFITALKLVLLFFFALTPIFFDYLFFILSIAYIVELILFARGIFNRSFKKPVKTFKIVFLSFVSFAVLISFFIRNLELDVNGQLFWILFFDILTPVIISAIVLLFQPFFVLIRKYTLNKAKIHLEKIKSLSGLKVIAITGSYGKTSAKEFLSAILSKKYRVLATKDHQNSEIGIAKCILNDLKPTAKGYPEFFIAEVGAYNKGKVKEVCSILNPKIGMVTGVNEQHISLFGSLKNLLSAEGGEELAESLPPDGALIVNGDNKYCLQLYKKTILKNKKIYSLKHNVLDADIWAEEVDIAKDHISFVAMDRSKHMGHFGVNVLGKQNVQNILGVILVARELGMTFEEISEACSSISTKLSGITLTKGKYGVNVIDSSYSSNPDGVFADLDYLSIFPGKKVIVMPCLIELGQKSPEIHEKIGKRIAEVCDLAIITTKDYFKEIEGGGAKCILCDKPQDIYSMITLLCKSEDAVLLEGRVPAGLIKLMT